MANKLEDLVLYQKSMELSDLIFPMVEKWQHFYQNTLGMQLVRAADSIAANISEGYGRYHYKDNKQFCYYARGSLFETKTHVLFAAKRGLINAEKVNEILALIDHIHRLMNPYINSIGRRASE